MSRTNPSDDTGPGWTLETMLAHMLATMATLENVTGLRVKVESLDRLTDAKFVTFRTLIDSNSEKVALALSSSDKAISKAEAANEKRFDSVNEFRAQLADQALTFARREYVEQQLATLSDRLDDANKARQLAIDEARRLSNDLLPREVFDTRAAAVASEADQLRTRCAAIESRLDVLAGALQGGAAKVTDIRATLAAGIGVATIVLAVVVFVANIITSR